MDFLAPRLKRVMHRAKSYASESKNNYVGTDHLLMAMFDEPETITRHVLESLGITREKLKKAIEAATK